jgi:hypothetical protein
VNPLPSAFTEQISRGPRSGFLAQTKAILLPSGDQLESPSTPLRLVSLVKPEPSGATEKRFAPSFVGRSKTSLPLVPGKVATAGTARAAAPAATATRGDQRIAWAILFQPAPRVRWPLS